MRLSITELKKFTCRNKIYCPPNFLQYGPTSFPCWLFISSWFPQSHFLRRVSPFPLPLPCYPPSLWVSSSRAVGRNVQVYYQWLKMIYVFVIDMKRVLSWARGLLTLINDLKYVSTKLRDKVLFVVVFVGFYWYVPASMMSSVSDSHLK